ncbi:MAG TPA: sigma factor-like helix-turn-helix DNA-binding protein, partial [Fimbriiglobus sp.]|nr:sigma factor-like helix-turn-helix DNA-binding protein [Fimbriiglobus sp.]
LALPERYRAALVLCCLEGLTHREAAGRLRCAEGTVSSLVSRGLAKLRVRLSGRDLAAALAVAAVGMPSVELSAAAVRSAAALQIASLSAAASPAVARLTEGVLRMFWIKKATAGVAVIVLLGAITLAALARYPAPAIAAPQPSNPPPKKASGGDKPAKPVEVPPADRVEAVVIPSAQTRRFDTKATKPILEMFVHRAEIAGVRLDPTDPTRVLITGLKPGVTELRLIDAGGGAEQIVVAVHEGDVVLLTKGETSPFQLPNNVAIKDAVCKREGVARTAVDPADANRLLITGLKAGVSELTVTGSDGWERILRVVVREDKKEPPKP